MSRRVGLQPVTAREQLQKSSPAAAAQPLPAGQGGRATAQQVGIKDAEPLTFVVIGDHGGIKTPAPQNAVAHAIAQVQGAAFIYSVGDVVYFNGDASQYAPQFYEPYAKLELPIVGIPGNHDGDTTDDPSRKPLDTFMANFCAGSPAAPAADPGDEYGRDTQTQPWCDWTLQLETVTIIGLYSNVPSGGSLEPVQTAWLLSELEAADTGLPLIVALHHPPYSVDAYHGGSQSMGDGLDQAFHAAGRWPELVLSGHVHDAQFFTRMQPTGKLTTYGVMGSSGYPNRHVLASDAKAGMTVAPGVVFEYGDADHYGFLTLTVASGKISVSYTGVMPGTDPTGVDAQITPNLYAFTLG